MLDSIILQCLPAWSVEGFLDAAKGKAEGIFGAGLILGGVILIGVAGVMTVMKLVSKNGNSTSWVKIVAMLLIGAALLGGYAVVKNVGIGLRDTVGGLGNENPLAAAESTILFESGPVWPSFIW